MGPSQQFAEIVRGAPDSVPLDVACALIAAHATPGLDVAGQLATFDRMAGECRDRSFAGVLSHLFGPGGFEGNADDYYALDNSLIDRVLQRRLGIPITLSIVAMEVGRRVGVPMVGIGMPGHFLVREARGERYADPFNGGVVLAADDCRDLFHRLHGPAARWDQRHLAPASRRAIVVRVLTNIKGTARQQGDLDTLRWVMRLRASIPGLADQERDEFRRMMAALN